MLEVLWPLYYGAWFKKIFVFQGVSPHFELKDPTIEKKPGRQGDGFFSGTHSICLDIIIIGLTISQEKGMFPYDAIIGY